MKRTGKMKSHRAMKKIVSPEDKMSFCSQCLAVMVMGLSLIVLVGWFTHSGFLVQVLPIWAPMQFNTALGFLLCGAALLAVHLRKTRVSFSLGALASLLGILTLMQYFLMSKDIGNN